MRRVRNRRTPLRPGAVVVAVLAALLVPYGVAGAAPNQGDDVVLSANRRVTISPPAGAPSDAGMTVGSPPAVTGSGAVDATAAPPRATATVSAQGRTGAAQARMGAAFTTTAPASGAVVGTLEVTIADLAWAGELRWDGAITDFSVPGPGGLVDGCSGCLEGVAAATVVASVVDLDTGEVLATQPVAAPRRSFHGPGASATPVSGSTTVTLENVVVASGVDVGVYVTLTVRAASGLRPGATTGSATANFSGPSTAGTTATTAGPTKPTRPPKPGTGARVLGVSYRSVSVKVVKTEPLVTPSACTGTEIVPNGAAATALVQYFRAIDDGDYATAFGLLAPSLRAGWAASGPSADGAANFAAFMREHVECVVVTGITMPSVPGDPDVSASVGIQWYAAELDAHYRSPFPAGSGGFPPFYKVRADPHTGAGRPPDQILDIVTSLPTLPASTVPPSSTTSTSTSTTTTTRPPASTTTSTSTTTTTTTTLPPRALVGPTTIVSLGDSFISGEAGRWDGNALNPLLDRAGTDRAFLWSPVTVFGGGGGFFGDIVDTVVGSVIYVPSYDTALVYGSTDAGNNHCHRSDVAEVNAAIPGIDEHINLACSGGIAENLWTTGLPPHRADGVLPAGVDQSSVSAGGVPQVTRPPNQAIGDPVTADAGFTQLERLRALALQNRQIKLIVVSIGGNDLQFADIVADCVFAYGGSSVADPDHCRPSWEGFVADSLNPAYAGAVPPKVAKTIDQIRLVMETPMSENGAGYARDQYRLVLQSYPSPIPRGAEFVYPEALPLAVSVPLALAVPPWGAALSAALTNGRAAYGCPFWDSDATWARDELVPDFSAALRAVAAGKGVTFLDLQDFLQDREICSEHTTMQLFAGSPSASSSEWARSIYLSAHWDLFQGDPKEAIHPNAYAQQGLQRCLLGAYAAAWNDPTASLRCINQPGGPENVTTVVEP